MRVKPPKATLQKKGAAQASCYAHEKVAPSDSRIQLNADYLLSYQAPGFDSHALDPRALNAEATARGKDLFYTKHARQSCHIADYKKDKGYVGPPLGAVGNRRPAVWIYKWLKDPQRIAPGTLMPNPKLDDREALDLTAFLVNLKAKENAGGK